MLSDERIDALVDAELNRCRRWGRGDMEREMYRILVRAGLREAARILNNQNDANHSSYYADLILRAAGDQP